LNLQIVQVLQRRRRRPPRTGVPGSASIHMDPHRDPRKRRRMRATDTDYLYSVGSMRPWVWLGQDPPRTASGCTANAGSVRHTRLASAASAG
jgi:hypothetical protein